VFQVYVPLVWDDIKSGTTHTITVSGPHGTSTDASFPVGEMPADSYRPNASLKFIGDRNPWVPTPTPVIVKVIETQIVQKIMTVTVTPSEAVVYAQQEKAMQEANKTVWVTAAMVFIAILIIAGVGLYARSVYRRAKQ
jgi:hypothetical protein